MRELNNQISEMKSWFKQSGIFVGENQSYQDPEQTKFFNMDHNTKHLMIAGLESQFGELTLKLRK